MTRTLSFCRKTRRKTYVFKLQFFTSLLSRGSGGSPPGLSNLDENMPKPGFSIFMVMLDGCKKNFSKKKSRGPTFSRAVSR